VSKSFTVLEILIVLVIISIIITGVVGHYNKAIKRQREENARLSLEVILEAEEDYFSYRGAYTDDWDQLDIDEPRGEAYDYILNVPSSASICIEARGSAGYRSFYIRDGEPEAQEGVCAGP